MARETIVTAIDIGTSAIKGIQVHWRGDGTIPQALSAVKIPASGVRKGVVENKALVADKIRLVLDELSRMSGEKIDAAIVNIGGGHIFSVLSQGVVVVSSPDQKITQSDIDRAINAAQAISLPPNKEIIDVRPISFSVDQEKGIKTPLGMKGMRMEAEILAICGFAPYIKNIYEVFSAAKIQILDLVPSAMASAKAVLNSTQRELGCAVMDIGSRTTDFAVFEEGELLHVATFPVGADNITDDIAIALKIDIDTAEKIKKHIGLPFLNKKEANKLRVSKVKKIAKRKKLNRADHPRGLEQNRPFLVKKGNRFELDTDVGIISFPASLLAKVVEARLKDIFEEANKELRRISRQELLPAGIILTGGGANLNNLVEAVKKELKLPCQLGFPQGIDNLDRDLSLSVACGLGLEGLSLYQRHSSGLISKSIFGKVKDILKMFIP